MASTAGVSAPIAALRSTQGQQPAHRRLAETNAQTFLAGVPVMLSSGYLVEWDANVANMIAGIAKEPGAGLTSSGVPKTLTYGSVLNQSSAVKIPRGAPLNDGRCGVDLAVAATVFVGQVGGTAATAANVGVNYGLTKDTDNHWYVDTAKTGADAVVQVVGLGPGSVSAEGARSAYDARAVQFVFLVEHTAQLG